MTSADKSDPATDSGRRRKRWLEELATACDSILDRDAGTTDEHHRVLLGDVAALRDELRAELGAEGQVPADARSALDGDGRTDE